MARTSALSSGAVPLMCTRWERTVASLANGQLEIKGAFARASFNLTGASFQYGPMQTWPRWPSPLIVEVNALRAEFANGDYLALAEGVAPDSISSPMLPR